MYSVGWGGDACAPGKSKTAPLADVISQSQQQGCWNFFYRYLWMVFIPDTWGTNLLISGTFLHKSPRKHAYLYLLLALHLLNYNNVRSRYIHNTFIILQIHHELSSLITIIVRQSLLSKVLIHKQGKCFLFLSICAALCLHDFFQKTSRLYFFLFSSQLYFLVPPIHLAVFLTGESPLCQKFLCRPIDHEDLEGVFLTGVQSCHCCPTPCGSQHQLWLGHLWKR